jgi:hypothetical protein
METRPELNKSISPKDFKEFYWLKEELVDFCRLEGLQTSGGKIEISERIIHYLKTGTSQKVERKPKPESTFNWKTEELTLNTVITDNYKNSENVRSFFEANIGRGFKFNIQFMSWMKYNVGKTLGDALNQYKQITSEKKQDTNKKEIAPQFEYNTYLRDFLADNPNSKRELGIRLWKIKRSMRGDNVYAKEDLKLIGS